MKKGLVLILLAGLASVSWGAGSAMNRLAPEPKTMGPTPAEKKPLVVPGRGTWRPEPPELKPLKVPLKRWCPVGPTALWRSL